MKQSSAFFKLPIILSVLLHIIIISLLFIKLPHSNKKLAQEVNIVQAQVISDNQLALQKTEQKLSAPSLVQDTIRNIEQTTLKQPEPPKTPISKPLPPKPELPKLVPQEVASETKEELPASKIDEQAELLAKQKKIAEQKKRKSEEAAKQAELKKKRREQEAENLKNELEKEAAQAKEEAQAHEEASEAAETQENASETATNEQSNSGAATASQSGELDKYKQMIVQTISRKWLIPETENKNLACQLLVHLGPGGIVLSVDIVKESGDDNLDRSARNAIMKASPLPVPENIELFDNFRALRLTFRPQGIISG